MSKTRPMPADLKSLIMDTGVFSGGECGYCHGEEGSSVSHGMVARFMNAETYQDLIDLGWRRSGTYLYKPDLKKTCCPQYTIRLRANDFQPSKRQAKLLRKWDSLSEKGGLSKPPDDQRKHEQKPPQQQGTRQQQHLGPSRKQRQQHKQANKLPTALAGVLQAAVDALVQQGLLPETDYPPVTVLPASHKQQHKQQQQQRKEQGRQHHAEGQQQLLSPAVPSPTAPSSSQGHRVLSFHSPSAFAIAARAARAVGVKADRPSKRGSQEPQAMDVDPPRNANHSASAAAASKGQNDVGRGSQPEGSCPAANPVWLASQLVAQVAAASNFAVSGAQPTELLAPHTASNPPSATVCVPGEATVMQLKAEGGGHLNWFVAREVRAGESGGSANASMSKAEVSLPTSRRHCRCAEHEACKQEEQQQEQEKQTLDQPQGHHPPPPPHHHWQQQQQQQQDFDQTQNHHHPQQQQQQQQSLDQPQTEHQTPPQQQYNKHHLQHQQLRQQQKSDQRQVEHQTPQQRQSLHQQRALRQTPQQQGPMQGAIHSGIQISIAPSCFDEEEFALYQKYQVEQHHDDIKKLSRKSYCRFLVDSPLPPPQPELGANSSTSSSAPGSLVPSFCGYGSFHMQYRVNGQLMAVGVVDILPRCLSAVYLFWDSAFAHLAPGKLSALKEIEWVQQASRVMPELQYYYMGFYIHTCSKMRYKADYHPSDLLCPESKAWVRIGPEVLRALDAQRYVVLSLLPGVQGSRNSAPVGVAAEREAPCLPSEAQEGAGNSAGAAQAQQAQHAGQAESP